MPNEDPIKQFLPPRSGRAVDHPMNSRDRAIGVSAATVGILGASDLDRLKELQADPSKAYRPATPAKAGEPKRGKTVAEFLDGISATAREKLYEGLIAREDFAAAQVENKTDYFGNAYEPPDYYEVDEEDE